jgi:hypothetical protein
MQYFFTFVVHFESKPINNHKKKVMKKVKFALIMLMAAVLILPACKKGANDPFISLKSRKARLVGEWTLKDGTTTQTSGGTTYTTVYNGTTATYTISGQSFTQAYTQKTTINKDGTYESDINDNGDLTTEKGIWFFAGKSKELDLKNKESVVFRITSNVQTSSGTTSTTTYSGTDCPSYTINIDELKGKEMIIIFDGSSTGSSTSSVTGTMTYEQ